MKITAIILYTAIALAAVPASAFIPAQQTTFRKPSALNAKVQLDEIDTMCILNQARYCEEGECSLDDVDALINQLEDQVSLTKKRINGLNDILESLGAANRDPEPEERDVDALREMMQSIAKIFGA